MKTLFHLCAVALLVAGGIASANPLSCAPGSSGYVAPSQTGCSVSLSPTSVSSVGGTVSVNATCPSGNGWNLDNGSVVVIGPTSGQYAYSDWTLTGNASTSTITWQIGRLVQSANNCSLILGNVTQAATYVTLQVSPNPVTVNQPVTITLTAHGASPSGTMSFFWNTTNLCPNTTLSGGSATCTYTPTATGRFSTGGSYSGDAQNIGSSANTIVTVQDVAPPPSTGTSTTLTSSLNPSTPGANVTFTATVQSASGTPAGAVSFADGSASLCANVALTNGVAKCSTSGLSAGIHSIIANFAGNATYPSSSGNLTQTVGSSSGSGKSNPSIAMTAAPNPVGLGSSLTMTAALANGNSPTGTVTFYADAFFPLSSGQSLCTATVASGQASCQTTVLTQGAHTLTATYSGDSNNNSVTSASYSQTVGPAGTTPPTPKLTLSTSPNPSGVGQLVRFNVGLDASLASGVVVIKIDGSTYCTYLVPNVAPTNVTACSTSSLAQGTHQIGATWATDVYSSPSQTASAVVQTVNAQAVVSSTTTLATSWSPSIAGHAIQLKATITGNTPGGSVTFTDGIQTLCNAVPVRIVNSTSVAYCVTVPSVVGMSTLTAVYSGDSGNQPSTGTLLQTVNPATAFNELQNGLTGAWGDVSGGGQGMLIDAMPSVGTAGSLFIGWFTYDLAGNPRWYVVGGGLDGKSLTIFNGQGGNFDAPPRVPADTVGTAMLTFADCWHATMTYSFVDGSHPDGIMPLVRLMASPTCTPAGDSADAGNDYGLSGLYFSQDAAGQALLFEMNPQRQLVFGAWYTYAQGGSLIGGTGTQRWFTFQGDFQPGTRTMQSVPIYTGTGGIFNDPTPIVTTAVGSATISFTDCNTMTLSYSFTGGELAGISKTDTKVRLGPTPKSCQ